MRDALASLPEGGGKRPRPPYGGRANLQKSDGGRINCLVRDAIYALGIGSDLASPAPGGTGAKSDPIPSASLTGLRPSRGKPVRDASSVGFLRPSERIAPLFARLGSLGELRSLSEPTKIRRRSHKLRPSRGNFCARNWVGFGLPHGGQIRRRPSRVGAPHGANYDAYATLTGPTLRANLASRIAGRFARTDAKILALITL